MACNVVRFVAHGRDEIQWGVLDGAIYPLEGQYPTTADFLRTGRKQAFALSRKLPGKSRAIALDQVKLLAPVTAPCQVLCQGANYRQHMVDSGMNPDDKKFNMIFNKSAASITGPTDEVVRPAHVALLDYEVELGLVIGADISEPREIHEGDLPDVIAGLVIGNDVSARDVQLPQMQFYKGKSYRSFCPVGPVLCLLEPQEFHYLNKLELQLSVNGRTRQRESSGDMVFKPAQTLSELTQIAHLNVGDLVLTGTPAGCALGIPSPLLVRLVGLLPERKKWNLFRKMQGKRSDYLQPGDVMELSIRSADGVIDLGRQRNTIVQG
ncbi:fumarylacetoacetate hydrolase family protein [Pseudomonas zhanjiangensis]|uniref:Fumarylacetoacetate hydrolase family protein n=1 Tax=Pseudomonas zhanjiangensis TaxID=3239015 RepID=A0ABV3YTA2_9PSED